MATNFLQATYNGSGPATKHWTCPECGIEFTLPVDLLLDKCPNQGCPSNNHGEMPDLAEEAKSPWLEDPSGWAENTLAESSIDHGELVRGLIEVDHSNSYETFGLDTIKYENATISDCSDSEAVEASREDAVDEYEEVAEEVAAVSKPMSYVSYSVENGERIIAFDSDGRICSPEEEEEVDEEEADIESIGWGIPRKRNV